LKGCAEGKNEVEGFNRPALKRDVQILGLNQHVDREALEEDAAG
jgi:hypothetical protein